ncbi:serine/threonine protein kinase [Streptomyces sp. ISL-22]|uniref:serine/threonine-protein kinase n=1 Tax=unclassified Streptomyces TaxID=2593676 RepID=UPI001BE6A9F1|nr:MULTISPECIES: serine/threonine-protein kinase [unclassified Streptomyces]MBT2421379.1 serine/threonine protein kinase [Streptomyces sp. ISL-24]MBT2430740.1 serine/threonine protein kinase [Streptomyces sp. ISL-22]
MSEAERAGTSRQDTRQDNRERLLAGRYRLGEVLGRGGMGTVWRAVDETLGRTVAVKELRFPSNIDEEEKRRLITRTLREAKAIARIRNNSAVTVFDVVDEDDRPWIVMELVEGKSLAEVIREDGLLEPKRAAEVGLAILDVLRSAHREGILHRDVKPSNVLLETDTGRVVLTDFGIAQVEGDPSITSTGMLVGAPSYISPERARGHKPGPAADLWSLGGLLYASVEGVPPYDKGSAIATLTAVMTEPLEEPKNAGPLKDVIYGLLTKDPAKRLDDAGARAMLNAVIHAPEPKSEPELDATRVVPLPPQPGGPADKGRSGSGAGSGAKRGEEAAERLRGALRSVRKAAASAGTAGSAVVARAKSGSGTAVAGTGDGTAGGSSTGAGEPGASSGSGTSGRASGAGAGVAAGSVAGAEAKAGAEAGAGERDAQTVNGQSAGRSSGWPVMPPPDLPPRPVPRAPLTDVVPKRTLVIIAVVVVLAVLGVVLAFALDGDGDGSKASASGGGPKASAGASASADTKQDESNGTHTDGENSASASSGSGSGSGAEAGRTPSAGASATGGSGAEAGSGSDSGVVSTHKGSQGYSIGLPKGWKFQSSGSAGDRFTGPDGQKLLVAWTTTPKDDPVADWKNQERGMVRSQYKRIRIEEVDYRGWNTADWEFTYVEGGTKYRTIDRGFVVSDDLGHALMYTAKASNWDSDLRKDTWKTLTGSFKPKS